MRFCDGEDARQRGVAQLQLALVLEAGCHLQRVLEQYRGSAARQERCLRETQLLGAAVSTHLDRSYCPTRADKDAAHLLKHLTQVISHPRVCESLRRLTDAHDNLCARWLSLDPGQHPGPDHELIAIDTALKDEPLGKIICRTLLQIPAEAGRLLGRPTRRRSSRWLKEVQRVRSQRRKLGAIAGKRRRRTRAAPVATARPEAAAAPAPPGAPPLSDSDASDDEAVDEAAPRPPERATAPPPLGDGEEEDEADDDPTPPTAPVAAAVDGASADASPAGAAVAAPLPCGYCGTADGDLWLCQCCGLHPVHEGCCAIYARHSYPGRRDVRALCVACARRFREERAEERAELEAALADVVNEAALERRLENRKGARGAALAKRLRTSLRLLVRRSPGIGEPARAAADLLAVECDVLRAGELLHDGAVDEAHRLFERLSSRLEGADARSVSAARACGDDAVAGALLELREHAKAAVPRCVATPLAFAEQALRAAAAVRRRGGVRELLFLAGGDGGGGSSEEEGEGGEDDAAGGGAPKLQGDDLAQLRARLVHRAAAGVVERAAVQLVSSHLSAPSAGLPLPPSLVRCTLEAHRTRPASPRTGRARTGPRRDAGVAEGEEEEAAAADGGADAVDEDADDEGAAEEAPRQDRLQQLLRRVVRRLAGMRRLGNSHSMRGAQMLERVISYFGRDPRSSRRRKSRLDLGPSVGADEVWLDEQVRRRQSRPYLEAFRRMHSDSIEMVSSDNASYFHHSGVGLTRELVHWTAVGSVFWPADAGHSRHDRSRELSRTVASWVVPSAEADSEWRYACVSVPPGAEIRRSQPVSFPLDCGRRLPSDWQEFVRVRSKFVPFDGTFHDAMEKLDGYLNLSDSTPTILSNVPEAACLTRWLLETRRQLEVVAWRRHHALDDVSTPVRRPRRTVVLQRNGSEIEEVSIGLRAHSQQLYPSQWNRDLSDVAVADLRPSTPLPLNSLSKVDALLVDLRLIEQAVDQTKYAWYNRLPEGDGNRPLWQRDLGSENISFGGIETTVQRLWRATLRPDDPEYARHHLPFASAEEAKDWVAVAGKLLTISTRSPPRCTTA